MHATLETLGHPPALVLAGLVADKGAPPEVESSAPLAAAAAAVLTRPLHTPPTAVSASIRCPAAALQPSLQSSRFRSCSPALEAARAKRRVSSSATVCPLPTFCEAGALALESVRAAREAGAGSCAGDGRLPVGAIAGAVGGGDSAGARPWSRSHCRLSALAASVASRWRLCGGKS